MKKKLEKKFDSIVADRTRKSERISYLENLLDVYNKYEPYIKYNKESWALRGWAKKKYDRQHVSELAFYKTYRSNLKDIIKEADKKIVPNKWRSELSDLETKFAKIREPYADTLSKLSAIEVLSFNRKDLERMLENESHKKNHELTLNRRTERDSCR